MLDLTGIMFSSIMMLIVIIRALQLDHTQPWFPTMKRNDTLTEAGKRAWQRQKTP